MTTKAHCPRPYHEMRRAYFAIISACYALSMKSPSSMISYPLLDLIMKVLCIIGQRSDSKVCSLFQIFVVRLIKFIIDTNHFFPGCPCIYSVGVLQQTGTYIYFLLVLID